MSVTQTMNKTNRPEYLPQEGLNHFDREPFEVVLFDEFIEGGAQGFENQAEVSRVVE